MYAAIFVGVLCTAWFRFGLKVPPTATAYRLLARRRQDMKSVSGATRRAAISPFLHQPMLYQAALLYMASRLFLTLSLVYIPLYLDESLDEDAETLASVPFVSFASSFVASLGLKYTSQCCDNRVSFLIRVDEDSLLSIPVVSQGHGLFDSLEVFVIPNGGLTPFAVLTR